MSQLLKSIGGTNQSVGAAMLVNYLHSHYCKVEEDLYNKTLRELQQNINSHHQVLSLNKKLNPEQTMVLQQYVGLNHTSINKLNAVFKFLFGFSVLSTYNQCIATSTQKCLTSNDEQNTTATQQKLVDTPSITYGKPYHRCEEIKDKKTGKIVDRKHTVHVVVQEFSRSISS